MSSASSVVKYKTYIAKRQQLPSYCPYSGRVLSRFRYYQKEILKYSVKQPGTLEVFTVRVFSFESITSLCSGRSVGKSAHNHTIHSRFCIECNSCIVALSIQKVFQTFGICFQTEATTHYAIIFQVVAIARNNRYLLLFVTVFFASRSLHWNGCHGILYSLLLSL